jgi:predicted O-linked N-acetylglucosamine transferase (SPINDLY family)
MKDLNDRMLNPMHHHPTNGISTSSPFSGIENELSADGLYALANWFDASRQPEQAIEFYKKAIASDPGFAEAHYNLGVIYNELNDKTNAAKYLQRSMALKPDMAECYSALGMIWCGQNRFDEALVLLEQAIAINPNFTEAHYNMGLVLQQMGRFRHGRRCFEKALVCNPAFAPARWRHLLSLPMLYDRVEAIEPLRRTFSANLDELIGSIKLETPRQIQYAVQGIQTATNFYLQYQGRNDLELQKKYGQLVHAVMAARYPHWNRPLSMPPLETGNKIKIGYVSTFMCEHTVGAFLSGWVENHTHADFRIHCYHLGKKVDTMTSHFKAISHRFHHFPGNVEAAAARIASDRLHVLVFSDIGMNTETLQLAALRLAPIQCKGWGHPVTTGLPTMDYYLSSDLMEPEDADRHYSETLVRLPNLALCYRPPRLPDRPMTRQALGIPADRFVYLSPQSIFKYLPQYDDIFPSIARQVPSACFVFLCNQSQFATQRFRDRLAAAFRRHHLNADAYCLFSQRLNFEGFLSLNLAADVLLDTFAWSGGKTTLEAIACGLPVVTCPGRFMRGRHAYAMLTRMGLTDTIAQDPSGYCRIATRLAADPQFHRHVKEQIVFRRDKLYNDQRFMAELENFYRSLVRRHHGSNPLTATMALDRTSPSEPDGERKTAR